MKRKKILILVEIVLSSTNHCPCCLTLHIGRDAVLSTWYGGMVVGSCPAYYGHSLSTETNFQIKFSISRSDRIRLPPPQSPNIFDRVAARSAAERSLEASQFLSMYVYVYVCICLSGGAAPASIPPREMRFFAFDAEFKNIGTLGGWKSDPITP